MSKKLAQLPFYWPPGPGTAELNAKMPETLDVSENMRDQFCAWFIHQDTALKSGITRQEVLSLFGDKLNLLDSEKEGSLFGQVGDLEFRERIGKLVSSFVEKGAGRLTEYKRLSGVSLQDSLVLLDDLIREHKTIDPDISHRLEKSLDEELAVLVAQLPESQKPAHPAPMEEVDIDDITILQMELEQITRDIEQLQKSTRALTDAEKDRLKTLENQRKQVQKEIKAAKK